MSANILARRPTRRWSVSYGQLFRVGLAVLLFFMLAVVANAYTLVLHSGRLITIPDKFKVTATAITYEASPGYSVTVWLSNVDIAATERANGELAGSFIERIEEDAPAVPARVPETTQTRRPADRKVVTNKELEPSRLRRKAQEEEYERTRHGRGMPSKQEMQQRIEEHDRWLHEWARRMQEESMEAELGSLKSELVNVRLQLSELSLQLSQQATPYATAYAPPNYYPYFYAPATQVITVFPFRHQGLYGRGSFGRHPHGRQWPFQPRLDNPFSRIISPSRGGTALPRAMPPRMVAPRHSR